MLEKTHSIVFNVDDGAGATDGKTIAIDVTYSPPIATNYIFYESFDSIANITNNNGKLFRN